MDRMFRVVGFFTLMFAIMAAWGGLANMALIFFAECAVFVALSYLHLAERTYMLIFVGYMVFSFVGIFYYAFFILPVGGEHPLALAALLAL